MSTMNHDVHPMVTVPFAIRTVMRETADILLKNKKSNPTLRICVSSTPWSSLLGCVLEEDVVMKDPGYPPYNASIMDGYAINTGEFSKEDAKTASTSKPEIWTHRVAGKVYAGDPDKMTVSRDEEILPSACYITTGAVVPNSYNCVVPVEDCEISASSSKIRIKPTATLEHNKWIRPVGCDISKGTVVLKKGHILDPVAIGLAKQSGADSIVVKRRIKVGVLSTGNELIVDDSNDGIGIRNHLQKGKIPDVNRPVLLSMLSTAIFQNTCEPIDLGTVRDDNLEAMVETMQGALDRCDIIITTGGVSMGETDLVERVLVDECGGKLHFGRMHMKPGKPTTFVTIPRQVNGENCVRLVFAQPGNPCSAVVCTRLLVGPCLDLYFHGIHGETTETDSKPNEERLDEIVDSSFVHPEIEATLTHDIKLDAKRPEYHRVILKRENDNNTETFGAYSTGVQRSSRLMSLRDAQGLMILPHVKGEKTVARKGESYPVLLLDNTFAKEPVKICDSIHLKREIRTELKVDVVQLIPPGKLNNEDLLLRIEKACEDVSKALNAPQTASTTVVVSKRTFSDSLEKLNSFLFEETPEGIDLIVVASLQFQGSFQYHLDVTKHLRRQLSKVANSLSLQARMGSASQDPKTAVFETIVGYVPNKNGSILLYAQENGLIGALGNIRSLITHGLRLARGERK